IITFLFFLLILLPPRSTLFPYTTLFRSQTRRLTLVFEIRRILTYRRKLVDAVVSTYTSRPLDNYVRCNHRALADLDVRADDRPGSDLNVVGQPCGRIDDGARVNQAHIRSEEHTSE